MSTSDMDMRIRSTLERHSQDDINLGIVDAFEKLASEMKRVSNEIESVRRQAKRRF